VATRKRKTTYPPARTDTKPAQRPGAGPEPYVRPTVATIDPTATVGKAGFSVGDRVRISGAGLYAGEAAIIEKLTTGVIPGALVRTEAGRTRQVRTVDLDPLPAAAPAKAAAPATVAADGDTPAPATEAAAPTPAAPAAATPATAPAHSAAPDA
jgi:hypothetical protein